MIRTVSIFVLLLLSVHVNSQNKNIDQVKKFIGDDKIEKAKIEIDKIAGDEKEFPEISILGAQIYFYIYKSKDPDIRKLEKEPEAKIIDFLTKYKNAPSKDETQFKQIVNIIKTEALNRADKAISSSRKKTAQAELEFVYNLQVLEKTEDANLIYNIASLAMDNNDISKATYYYELAVEKKYSDPEVYLRLNDLYSKMQDWEKQEYNLERGRRTFPENHQIAFNEINYYMNKGNVDKLQEVLKYLIEKNANNALYRFTLANVYENTGNIENAEQEYILVLKAQPDYFDAAFYLGNLYLKRAIASSQDTDTEDGDFSKATTYLEKAQDIDPTNIDVLKSLEQLYSLTGQNEKFEEIRTKLNKL